MPTPQTESKRAELLQTITEVIVNESHEPKSFSDVLEELCKLQQLKELLREVEDQDIDLVVTGIGKVLDNDQWLNKSESPQIICKTLREKLDILKKEPIPKVQPETPSITQTSKG